MLDNKQDPLKKEYINFMEQIQNKSLSELEKMGKALVDFHENRGNNWLCSNYLLEEYLYEFWYQEKEVAVTPYRIHEIYARIGKKQEELGKREQARRSYKLSLEYNPLDLDHCFAYCEFLRKNNELFDMKNFVMDSYPFLYTASDISHFYRILGVFYLENYKPDVAAALYEYSLLFAESEMARQELDFLRKAAPDAYKDYTTEEMVAVLNKNNIPLQPAKETLGLVYEVAKLCVKQNKMQEAFGLFSALFELTGDEEIKEIISHMQG